MSTPLDIAKSLGYEPPPLEWPTTSVPPLPVEVFGKDHWSTFAYVETRIVDHRGRLEHDHMRCHEGRHPLFTYAGRRNRVMGPTQGSQYATRLVDGTEHFNHDDYDCLDDLVAAGMLVVAMPEPPDGVLVTGLVEMELARDATWSLTDYGRVVAGALRAHLGEHRRWSGFTPPAPP